MLKASRMIEFELFRLKLTDLMFISLIVLPNLGFSHSKAKKVTGSVLSFEHNTDGEL